MENIAYTTKERAAVNTAWDAITYAADRCDHTAGYMLREALRGDKGRPLAERKANLIGAFAMGAEQRQYQPSDFYGYTPGWISLVIFGGHYAKTRADDGQPYDRLSVILDKITAGRAAHDAALQRFLRRND